MALCRRQGHLVARAVRSTPGGQQLFSDLAIEPALTLRLVFSLPLRQTEGFLSILGKGLHARTPGGQSVDVQLACNILGRMTALGTPQSYGIGGERCTWVRVAATQHRLMHHATRRRGGHAKPKAEPVPRRVTRETPSSVPAAVSGPSPVRSDRPRVRSRKEGNRSSHRRPGSRPIPPDRNEHDTDQDQTGGETHPESDDTPAQLETEHVADRQSNAPVPRQVPEHRRPGVTEPAQHTGRHTLEPVEELEHGGHEQE
ncbi:MAG: hypothetical protein E2P06_02420 [Acidobacteria bacterium]|nr:MAG: hypothetical protein E2P06_02420 [Acidobacteriota bacterium]